MKQPTRDQNPPESTWDIIKYRLAITGVVLSLVLLLLMMVDGAVRNGQCSVYQFITFECNRWDAKFKPWQ